MSSHQEVIRLNTNIEIDPDLIKEAQEECNALDLKTTESFKVFQPEKKAKEILDLVKKQSKRSVLGRSLHVPLPGDNTKFLRTPCIAIPIRPQSLPQYMVTRSGQTVAVSWKAGRAWEILEDVKFQEIKTEQAHAERGILLLLHLTA